MVRLLVISDTHGAVSNYQSVLKQEAGKYDRLIHLGDGAADSARLFHKIHGLLQLKGNMDAGIQFEPGFCIPLAVITEEGVTILAVHGDKLGVKNTLLNLYYEAHQQKAGLALYGHTHVPRIEEKNGVVLFNPGALKYGYYGVIEINDGKLNCIHKMVEDIKQEGNDDD